MSGSHPLGMAEFFALEAGEYLQRLDALLAAEGAPAAEEFVRLARALRGSALMASQPAIGRAAAGLEGLARAVREGRRGWDAGLRQTATRAVDDLKILVRRVPQWTDSDTRAAESLATHLEQIGGRPSAQVRAVEALGLDAGARAFIAREGAAIASALDRAAHVLRVDPRATDPLASVRRAIEPLRGLAALNDLPPLGDLLEGVEQALGHAPRVGAPVGDFFAAAAGAIAQAAREVAERGRPDPDAPAFRTFAGLLVRLLDAEPDVVPIESLFHLDGGPHLVRRGTPARPPGMGRLELVSHGEHMRQAADQLERAPSATQRELRAHALAGTLRALLGAGGDPLGSAVAGFAAAARNAIQRGVPVTQPAPFAADLRRAGELLAAAASQHEANLAERLAAITEAMERAAVQPPAPAPAVPAAATTTAPAPMPPGPAATPQPATPSPEAATELATPAAIAPRRMAAPPPVVPRPPTPAAATPAPAAATPTPPVAPDRVPAAPSERMEPGEPVMSDVEFGDGDGPADLEETPDFVGTWLRYERLREQDTGPASLEELLGGAAATTTPDAYASLPLVDVAAERASAAPPDERLAEDAALAATPAVPEPPIVDVATLTVDEPAPPIVDIATLLYRGERALVRASELRAEAGTASPDRLRAILDEVCDLVALAHDADT